MSEADRNETERRYRLIREEILRLFYTSKAIGQRREAVSANTAEQNLISQELLEDVLNPGGNFSQEYFYASHPDPSEQRDTWAHIFVGLEDPENPPGQRAKKSVRRFRPIPGSEHLAPPPAGVLRGHPNLIDKFPSLGDVGDRDAGQSSRDEGEVAPPGQDREQVGPESEEARYATRRPSVPRLPVAPEIRDAVWDEAHGAHFDTQDALEAAVREAGMDPLEDRYWTLAAFDVGWRTPTGVVWVCEAKSLVTNPTGKLRLGLGQALDYRQRIGAVFDEEKVEGALAVSAEPPDLDHWLQVSRSVGVQLIVRSPDGSVDLPQAVLA